MQMYNNYLPKTEGMDTNDYIEIFRPIQVNAACGPVSYARLWFSSKATKLRLARIHLSVFPFS